MVLLGAKHGKDPEDRVAGLDAKRCGEHLVARLIFDELEDRRVGPVLDDGDLRGRVPKITRQVRHLSVGDAVVRACQRIEDPIEREPDAPSWRNVAAVVNPNH